MTGGKPASPTSQTAREKIPRDDGQPEQEEKTSNGAGYEEDEEANGHGAKQGNGSAQAEENHTWENPDISLLDDRRGELPEFPLDTLHPNCRKWLQSAAHGAGVTLEHVAVPLLGVVSSLIGTARRVQASRSWSQPLTTWMAIIGLSGTGKTPGIDVVKNALGAIVKDRGHEIDARRRRHETLAETAKAANKLWKDEIKEALESGTNPPVKPAAADDPGPFITPQLYVSDATIERLGILLTVRPQGMLLLADELAGLFANMSRYSGGQDNEFWLECWNGSAYVIERMSRPPLQVPHLLIGITGGMRPISSKHPSPASPTGCMRASCSHGPPNRPTARSPISSRKSSQRS